MSAPSIPHARRVAAAIGAMMLASASGAGAAIVNGTFESPGGLAGWGPGYPSGTVATLESGTIGLLAHGGTGYARFAAPAGSRTSYAFQNLDDHGHQRQGTTYAARAWVRGNATSIGKPVVLRIRERAPSGDLVAETSSTVPVAVFGGDKYPRLGGDWQELVVGTSVQHRGDRIDVHLVQLEGAPGDAVDVDDVTLTSPATSRVNNPPLGNFSVSPGRPVVGQPVTLTDTSTDPDSEPDGIATEGQAWDFSPTGDGDGSFTARRDSAVATVTFTTPGVHVVREQVADRAGATSVVAHRIVVTRGSPTPPIPPPPPPPPNHAPDARFTLVTGPLETGRAIAFVDASVDSDGSIVSRAWDLDGDGMYDDATGVAASRTFGDAGIHTVRLLVVDEKGASATASIGFAVVAAQGGSSTTPPVSANGVSVPGTRQNVPVTVRTRRVRVCRYVRRNGKYVIVKGHRKVACKIVVKRIVTPS